MTLSDKMIKRIAKAAPSEYADIIMDLHEDGFHEEAEIMENALDAYNKFQTIVRYGGDKDERDIYAADFDAYMFQLAEKIFTAPDILVSSKVFSVFNKTLNESLKLIKEAKEELDLVPTDSMVKAAQRGLDLRKEFGRGGTAVGVARARDIVNRKNLSPGTIKRMYSFFSRHEVDKQASGWKKGEEGYPSSGLIAWLLWGGDAGYTWATKKRDQLAKKEESLKKLLNKDAIVLNEDTEILSEASGAKQLLFSSDIADHYSGEQEITEHYIEALQLSDEELEEIDRADTMLAELAYDWASDFIGYDFREQKEYILRYINQHYENFLVTLTVNNWRGRGETAKEKVYDIAKYVASAEVNYRGLDHMRAFLINGKVVIEFQHHDATDVMEIMAYANGRPVRIIVD